jgi:amino acid adenylation domain-containing protein
VLSQAEERGVRFSLQQLFQYQTISELAQELSTQATAAALPAQSHPFSLISPADRLSLPADVADAYPLTMLQVGMIFHSEYRPGTAVYHDIFSFHLQMPFDLPALQMAVQQLVDNHAVLRTSFELSRFSTALQLVHRTVSVPIQVIDVRQLSPQRQEQALAAWFETETEHPFDWTVAPLLRLYVHRRSDAALQLAISFHHAILDGWSVASLLTEFFNRYLALIGAQVGPFDPPPTTTFRDFVALEQHALASQECRQYWLDTLRDSTTTTLPRWPASRQGAAPEDVRRHNVPIAAELSDGLKHLARSAGVPLKTVLLAAHMRVLSLLSGRADVLTGMVSHGRPETTDGERVLGLFLNSVPVRLSLAGGSWLDLVRATFAAEQALLPFQRYPLAEIQRLLRRPALFEVLFNFTHYHVYQGLQGLYDVQTLGARVFEKTDFPLVAHFSLNVPLPQIQLDLLYQAGEFCDEQVGLIGGYYASALAAMAGDSRGRYETCSLLSAQERRQLLATWNAAQTGDRTDIANIWCIHRLFEAQAAHTPDAIAVVFIETTDEGRKTKGESPPFGLQSPRGYPAFSLQLTYRELNERANRLAHHLRGMGVGPEVPVAVCMERSPELIVGLLGVLKAGGVYVPLDPAYPKERLTFMLEDSRAAVLVMKDERRRTMDEGSDCPFVVRPSSFVGSVVDLNADWPRIVQGPQTNPDNGVLAGNLAYAIYTSGSTGRPKSVLIAHEAIAAHCRTVQRHYQLTPRDRVLQFASLNFDAALEQVLSTLVAGAALVLRGREVWTAAEVYDRIGELNLTVANFPPAYWRQLVEEAIGAADQGARHQLRLVIVGGDVLPPESLALWQRTPLHAARLLNAYGPTETTITATTFELSEPPDPSAQRVPIGRPLDNRTCYVLDRHGNPAPIGAPAELHIGGVGLARGYLNRPDLTAERFVPNPFLEMNDERPTTNDERPVSSSGYRLSAIGYRLYRTGDLARYLPDGMIEFLGRIDEQVKIRGFRVEPAEIEAALAQHPGVRDAVVVARDDMAGEKRLVAYVVQGAGVRGRGAGEAVDPSIVHRPSSIVTELRAFLADRLPDYMLPSAFVLLDALPLTPIGKLDRGALPAPQPERAAAEGTFSAPRDLLELQLAQIWEEVLGVHPIGVRDDFFALGGHSLLAVRLMARIAQRLGRRLPLSSLFEGSTVEQLAAVLRRQLDATPLSPLVGIQPHGARRPFFCVHPAGGEVLCYMPLARHLGPEQPFYGVQAPGLDDGQAPLADVEAMAAHYLAAVRAAQPDGPYLLGGWSAGGLIAFEMAQQLQAQGQQVALLALFDTWLPQCAEEPEDDDRAILRSFAQDLDLGLDLSLLDEPGAQLAAILEQAQQAGALPPDIGLDQIRRILEVFRANRRAVRSYEPQPYPGRITYFQASEAEPADERDPVLEWATLAAGGMERHVVPGTHFTIVGEPHVKVLAERLSACLAALVAQA